VIRSKFHPPRDVAIGLAAVLLFAWFAWLASQGAPPDFDIAGRDATHAYARPWLTLVMQAASLAGGGWGLWPVGALIAGLLARAGRGRETAVFAIAVLGANFVNEGMKLFFHRPRPEPWFGYPEPPTYSFPSGHSFVSFCFFLCLAEILMRHGWPLWGKVAIWSAALGCTLTIGLSRVYLGVHYPTDVLGGYAAGIVWTMLIRLARHVWQARTAGAEKVEATRG
jgi:membrane-associated phospholipid phosphatase